MFCPKCGNELAEGAKFCAVCGEQIVKEAAVASTLQNHTTKGAAGKKPILTGVIAVVAILAVVLIINAVRKPSDSQETGKNGTIFSKEDGFDSYEEVIDALFTAAYNKDVEAVVDCFPEEMESYVKTLYNAYRTAEQSGGWSGDNLNYETGMFFRFEKLNMDNEYWYEIVEATELEQSIMSDKPSVFSKDELQAEYGLTIDEAYIVEVRSMGKHYVEQFGETGYATDGSRGYYEVAKIGKKWYLLRIQDAWLSSWCD